MANECTACASRGAGVQVQRAPWRVRCESGLGFLAGLGAVLAPKCPLCLSAYFSLCGVTLGLGAANFLSPLLRPVGLLLAVLVLGRITARKLLARRRSGRLQKRQGTPA
jgi:hypothetical protein